MYFFGQLTDLSLFMHSLNINGTSNLEQQNYEKELLS